VSPPLPPESSDSYLPWLGLDRLGILQVLGGLILGLIALLSSYDHITFAGRTLPLPQQWGIPCIAASVATVFDESVQYSAPLGRDAQLATRSRLRAEHRAVRATQDSARAEDEAARERYRADRERNRAAEARELQRESLERLDQAALLSARVLHDPSPANRERLRAFLTLRGQGGAG
jgi:hypothetical protein